jgi:ATP-binding cassette subfamily B protein
MKKNNIIEKLKTYRKDIIYASKLTKTERKKARIILTVILSNLMAAADIGIILIFTSIITDSFQSDNALSFLVQIFLDFKFLIPLLILFRFLILFAQTYNMKSLEMSIERNLKVYLLNEVFERGNFSIADAYFYTNQLAGHVTFFYGALTSLLNVSIQIIGFTTYLIISDSTTLLYFAIGIAVLFYPLKYVLSLSRKLTDISYWKNLEFSYDIQKIVENMFLIKILNKQKEELQSFKENVAVINNLQLKTTVIGQIIGYLPTFVTMFVLAILVNSARIVSALSFDFIAVMLRLFQSIGGLANAIGGLVNSHVHMGHFTNFDQNKLKDNRANYIFNEDKNAENIITADGISFKYFNSDIFIFEDINFEIKKGEHTIITGPNGSGKSTLLGMVAGVLYPVEGKLTTKTQKFGYIGATPLIFSNTLRYNLLYGTNVKVDDTKILNILKELDTFKEESSYDLDKEITNKTLSSGQMQKVAFTRALISDIDVLLLDESTANLDDLSKDKIFKILANRNITIFNSTHDPSSFIDVDNHFKIDVVDEKRYLRTN